jgi:hypothetical protein
MVLGAALVIGLLMAIMLMLVFGGLGHAPMPLVILIPDDAETADVNDLQQMIESIPGVEGVAYDSGAKPSEEYPASLSIEVAKGAEPRDIIQAIEGWPHLTRVYPDDDLDRWILRRG